MKLTDAERSYIEHMDWPESCAEHFKAAGYRAGVEAALKVAEDPIWRDVEAEGIAGSTRALLD